MESFKNHVNKLFYFNFFNLFFFYFILLYNTVLVLPYIDMNPPQVYMCSQTCCYVHKDLIFKDVNYGIND